jgi:hypothetical protein
MNDTYIEWRKNEYLLPIKLINKEKFYDDLLNIEHSWSGRMDSNLFNTFIMESVQLLVNSMELFEIGYFDCAYYTLRASIEISTTMVFLTDMPNDERENYLKAWKNTKDFPMQGKMIRQLSDKGDVFADMKEQMPDFFNEVKKISAELNKYVHKQGLKHFYISRNHPVHKQNKEKSQVDFINNFEYYLKKCIGIIAVMRLAIDPFPVLLMDEEILYRCFDSMTDPYSIKFAEEYIGKNTLDSYKKTNLFIGTFDSFVNEEKKTSVVFNVVKHQVIDSTHADELLKQLHLMSKWDVVCTLMVLACDKIVKTYACGGMQMYFTEKNTNRKTHSWSGLDFKNFEKSDCKHNQLFDEAFISVFIFGDETYFAEHNEKLTSDEIASINSITNLL